MNKNNVDYVRQHKFIGCKFKNKLPFDFYLPKHNICIEYDGRQHFIPVSHFGGEESFEIRKKCDIIKNEFCEKNNIKLFRISYKEMITDDLIKGIISYNP